MHVYAMGEPNNIGIGASALCGFPPNSFALCEAWLALSPDEKGLGMQNGCLCEDLCIDRRRPCFAVLCEIPHQRLDSG